MRKQAMSAQRFKQIALWTLVHLDDLVKKGYATQDGGMVIADAGRAECERMVAGGFECTPEEIQVAMSAIMATACGRPD